MPDDVSFNKLDCRTQDFSSFTVGVLEASSFHITLVYVE